MSAPTTDDGVLSAECAVGARPGYGALHDRCRQTRDVPLPHSTRITLVHRCRCSCHGREASK
ncbi:hypothetical protein [Streptomyces sp. NPDC050263]|uniref:hypothetical protein n=1 Tax=Streptomyces sp. NPDC050263 TaxID=3155037 RepID=UPI00342D2719